MSALLFVAVLGSFTTLQWVSDGSSFFELPDSVWVAPGTAVALVGEDTLTASVTSRGSRVGLELSAAPDSGSLVLISFDRLPLSVRSSSSVALQTADGASSLPVEHDLPSWDGGMQSGPPGLYISGQKRLGLSVGEGGGLDQGLRLSMQGYIAPGVQVTGELTDQNLPLGSGSSELLSELDRVTLGVIGQGYSARLGDMDWKREGPALLSWDREVSGIEAGLDRDDAYSVEGGYAISGDRSGNVVLYTSEGVQGPYELVSKGGIAPGSERIYLDGEPLTRGVTADYTIDYSAGLLTFTPSRLIRRDQRVEACFARETDGYRRELITTGAVYALSDALVIGVAGLSESDDLSNPIGFSLGDEELQALENAGGEQDSAYVYGGEYVGEGEGSYEQDSLSHFVYAGPGLGSWRVHFSRPPEGEGDYVYDSSIGGYSWVGEGEGTHLPRRYLALPERHRTGGLTVDLGTGVLSVDAEAAFSNRTANLVTEDQTTRSGACVRARALLTPFEADGPSFGVSLRTGTDGFRPPGRLEADSSLASWSLPPGYSASAGSDEIGVLSVSAAGATLSTGVRLLGAGGGGRLERSRGMAELRPTGDVRIGVNCTWTRRVDTEQLRPGSRLLGGLSGSLRAGALEPRLLLGLQRDAWSDSLSGYMSSFGAGLGASIGRIEGDILLTLELDKRSGDLFTRPARTLRGVLELSGPGLTGGSVSARVEHSESMYEEGGSVSADAIALRGSTSSEWGWAHAIYNGSGVIAREVEVRYRYVGEGEGDYSYDEDTGTYYPDPDGDYEKYYTSGEEGELSLEADLSASASIRITTSSGIDVSGRLSNSSSGDRLRALLLLDAILDSRDASTERDLTVSPWVSWSDGLLRRVSARASVWNERTTFSGSGARTRDGWRLGGGPRLRPAEALRVECELEVWREREDFYEARDTRGVRVEVDPTLLAGQTLEVGTGLALEWRDEVNSGLGETMYEIRPHFTWRGGGWNTTAWTRVSYIPGSGDLPPWFFDLLDRGISLRTYARIGRSLGHGLDLSTYYSGRRLSGSDWVHSGGVLGTLSF